MNTHSIVTIASLLLLFYRDSEPAIINTLAGPAAGVFAMSIHIIFKLLIRQILGTPFR